MWKSWSFNSDKIFEIFVSTKIVDNSLSKILFNLIKIEGLLFGANFKKMKIEHIIKRDFTTRVYDLNKITGAIEKAMGAVGVGDKKNAEDIALLVNQKLLERKKIEPEYIPTIEQVQDTVETKLMESQFPEVAKAYILYRNKRSQQRQTDIFEKRINLKPYEYPNLYEYVPAIRHSYWIHSEFNFTSDIQDFKSRLSPVEKNAIKNTMLAISQIEVAVKSFWGDLYHRIPKPEVGSVGSTFAESEVRHADAYSHLLEILGLNSEFSELKKKPAIMKTEESPLRILYCHRLWNF